MMSAVEVAQLLTPSKTGHRQDAYNFIITFYEKNCYGPWMWEVQEGLTALYGEPFAKSTTYSVLLWLHQRHLISLVREGKTNRRTLRIAIPKSEWRFTGHRNVYLRSSVTKKNVL